MYLSVYVDVFIGTLHISVVITVYFQELSVSVLMAYPNLELHRLYSRTRTVLSELGYADLHLRD